ncbi:unnamed protein product [Macrosiphum euphorbiae]|uniref:Uncharacterized protein n=1 Tax=Macrosiphum euphorbiae TaxID=13131 RepID=A0AAV0XW87_9HEMI|nr:unnamed protein product [Macrosiphum euphorbiae]
METAQPITSSGAPGVQPHEPRPERSEELAVRLVISIIDLDRQSQYSAIQCYFRYNDHQCQLTTHLTRRSLTALRRGDRRTGCLLSSTGP